MAQIQENGLNSRERGDVSVATGEMQRNTQLVASVSPSIHCGWTGHVFMNQSKLRVRNSRPT